jgi:hypothetical protein
MKRNFGHLSDYKLLKYYPTAWSLLVHFLIKFGWHATFYRKDEIQLNLSEICVEVEDSM